MEMAKRVGPPKVSPLVLGDLRIEVVHWGRERGLGQNGGYIAAHDRQSGRELWLLRVYAGIYEPGMETDVQDVFIRQMSRIGDDALEVTDERGRRYRVELRSRTVTPA